MKKTFLTAFISLTSLLGFSYITPVKADAAFYPNSGHTYRIVSGGQTVDSSWDINMEGNSAGWGTPAITYSENSSFPPRVNNLFKIVWDETNRAYTIRPMVEKNGDACLTENSHVFLELQKCIGSDYSDNQHFWVQCTNQDNFGNLTGCYISNARKAGQAIGTHWDLPTNPIGETNISPQNALWWSLEYDDQDPF